MPPFLIFAAMYYKTWASSSLPTREWGRYVSSMLLLPSWLRKIVHSISCWLALGSFVSLFAVMWPKQGIDLRDLCETLHGLSVPSSRPSENILLVIVQFKAPHHPITLQSDDIARRKGKAPMDGGEGTSGSKAQWTCSKDTSPGGLTYLMYVGEVNLAKRDLWVRIWALL
jgi:hypothetical protein